MNQDNSGAPAWGTSPGSRWGSTPPSPVALPTPAPLVGSVRPGAPGPGTTASGAPVSAPVVWLAVAAALEAVGLSLGLMAAGRPVLSVSGWLIGGFAAILALSWFTVVDSRRRTDAWYSTTGAPSAARAVLAGFAVAVVTMNALQFADWASRR